MAGVFISYRREDATAWARLLHTHLEQRLGIGNVFMDVESIELGRDFRDVLRESVGSCDALICVIGQRWLSVTNTAGERRLDDPNDFVRIEVATALERANVNVIPVLVDEARMPDSAYLPDNLKDLVYRNGMPLPHQGFDGAVNRLGDMLASIVGVKEALPVVEAAMPEGVEEAADHVVKLGGVALDTTTLNIFKNDPSLFIAPHIPQPRLATARDVCGVPGDEEVYVMMDCTVLGNGKDAVLITDAGIRSNHSNADFPQPQHIPMVDLVKWPVEKYGWYQIGVGNTRITVSGGPNRDKIIDTFNAVRSQLGG